jgi:hypothetical protein
MNNEFLVPVELAGVDLVSSEPTIEFLNQNKNVMQAYEQNFLGEWIFYTLPHENITEPAILTENDNQYFVL